MNLARVLVAAIGCLGLLGDVSVHAEVAMPAELVTLRSQYEAGLARSVAPVKERYLATLNMMLEGLTRAGNLDDAVAVNTELKSIKESGKTTTSGEKLPSLRVARDQYEKELSQVTQQLQARYIAALDAMVTNLTKRGLLDEALMVKHEEDRQKVLASRVAAPPMSPKASRRPTDAVFFQGKYYKTFDSVVSWTQAQEKCVEMGGQLATVTHSAENDHVISMALMGKRDAYWLGATDKDKEGVWMWVDGRLMTYTNWGHLQPNNKQLAEHYLLMVVRHGNAKVNLKWSDQPKTADGHRPGFICEWKS